MPRIFIYFLLLLSSQIEAQNIIEDSVNDVYKLLYGRIDTQNYHLTSKLSDTDQLLFINAYHQFWNGLISSNFKLYFHETETIINENIDSVNNKEIIAFLDLLKLRINFCKHEYFSVLLYSNRLKNYFKNNPTNINNENNLLLWGIYNYAVASARKSVVYRAMLSGWPQANKEYGIETLETLSHSNSVFISTESTYVLGKIYLELENSPHIAKTYFFKLTSQFPGNCIYRELYNLSCHKTSKQVTHNTTYNKQEF